ncbi:MAG TPA: hypothetical protein PLP51_03945 [Acholeplasmataceae bacterium]|nr:hypothetical protein [Acholeplasmataceae bacterium]
MSDTIKLTNKQFGQIREKISKIEESIPFIFGKEKFGQPIDMALTDFWLDVEETGYRIHFMFDVDRSELTTTFVHKLTNKTATTIHKDFVVCWQAVNFCNKENTYFTEESYPAVIQDLSTVVTTFYNHVDERLRDKSITIYTGFIFGAEILCKALLCLPSIWKKESFTVDRNNVKPGHFKIDKQSKRREVELRNIYMIRSGLSIKNVIPSKHLTCPCWGVRGHYRHLSNGKIIFIKPYRKGKLRNKPEAQVNKDYVKQKEKK